ncbi:MAG TPA: sugar-binding protein [Anaerolineae bacterium]|nr:sugar-binding protein [Anaerolineae bacterium]
MGYQDDLNDTWADLAPEQPAGRSRWPLILVGGAALLILLCICSIGSYFVYQEFLTTAPEPTLPAIPPTAVSGEAGAEAGSEGAPSASPESESGATGPPTPPLAPTVTVPPSPTDTSPVPTGAPLDGSTVEAMPMAEAPVLDGSLAEWLSVPAWSSTFLVFQDPSWNGSDDLQATWRLAWDSASLYIGVEVIDDIHVQTQTGNQIFRGDSVDMQIDTDREGDFGPRLSPDDFQLTFSPGDFAGLPPSAFRSQGSSTGQILDAPGGHHIVMAVQRTAVGYNVEAAIPWTDLNLAPSAGMVLGLALNANDNDSPGTAVQEVMKSHVASRTLTDPTGWGTLTLR